MNTFQHYPADEQLLLGFDNTYMGFHIDKTTSQSQRDNDRQIKAGYGSMKMKTFLYITPKPEVVN